MPRLIRSAVFTGYIEVARALGLDPYRLIAQHDLPAVCLTDPEIRVPALATVRLLEATARLSGKSDVGLRLAERRSLSNVGAFALLVREQPTLRRAIEMLVGYMHLHSEALALSLEERDGMATLKLVVDVGRPLPLRQSVELGLGFLHRSLQLLDRSWKPAAVYFTHDRPERIDAHRRFFGTTVKFGQDFNGIIWDARTIDAPLPACCALTQHDPQELADESPSCLGPRARPRRLLGRDRRRERHRRRQCSRRARHHRGAGRRRSHECRRGR